MKNKTTKILSIVALALLTFAALLGSCKQHNVGTYTGSDKQPLNITIAQNEMIKFTKTNEAGRTIVAEPFQADGLTFYMWGTSTSGQSLNPKNVTVTSTNGLVGKIVLDIDCFNWSLTLAACASNDLPDAITEEAIMAKAVLIGYGNVDMMFTNSIKFTLTPRGLSKTGFVDLSIKLQDGMVLPAGYTATAYIYDITTGLPVKSAGANPADLFTVIEPTTTTAAEYTANDSAIAPGTYSFQVEFTKAGENRKFVWNDTLIILPGKTAEKDIIIPNLIGTIPADPSQFNVYFNKYGDKAGSSTELEEAKYPGLYVAHFTWSGSGVSTETNFALELVEIADNFDLENGLTAASINSAAGFTEILATAANYNAEYMFNYLNDIRASTRFYKTGSLFANNEFVDVYLELGKRYIARLYAENNAGYSQNAAYLVINPVETGAAMNTINRFRVKYYPQGGIWNEGAQKGQEGPAGQMNKIVYWSQSDSSHKYNVLTPVKGQNGLGSTGNPYLYKSVADWIYWLKDLASGDKYDYDTTVTTYTPLPYDGFKNLNLYAVFAREGDFEIYDDKAYDIKAAWVNAFGYNGTITSSETKTFSKNGATAATVTVKLPENNPWKYDKVSLSISYSGMTYFDNEQVGAAANVANTFTIPLGLLPVGVVYNCVITAQYQMTTVSFPFTINLTD